MVALLAKICSSKPVEEEEKVPPLDSPGYDNLSHNKSV